VVLPGIDAHYMEVLLACATILQILVLFIHFREADGAIWVILEVNLLAVLLGGAGAGCHSAVEPLSELLVEHIVGSS